MRADLAAQGEWVLSGSLDGWGDPLIPLFGLAVFVYVPKDIRLERIRKREAERYGDAVLPGGERYEASREFIEWAAGYDSGLLTGRSLPRHEKWMAGLRCPLLRITNGSFEDSVDAVAAAAREAC
jgi:hypothetical protein